MYFCYVDESGCPGKLPNNNSPVQPVLAITGLIINETALPKLTTQFLTLKRTWFPGLVERLAHSLGAIEVEIKGNGLKKSIRNGGRNERRHALGFMNKLFSMLDTHNVKLLSQIYIKEPSGEFNGQAAYASAIQKICVHFHQFLVDNNQTGLVIADGRDHAQNRNVSNSVFTQMYKCTGDAYPRLSEAPVFGDSKNHVGIQLTDIITSAALFPIAAYTYCTGHIHNTTHVHPEDRRIKEAFARKLSRLQYRYENPDLGRYVGGITVSDKIERRRSGALMLTP